LIAIPQFGSDHTEARGHSRLSAQGSGEHRSALARARRRKKSSVHRSGSIVAPDVLPVRRSPAFVSRAKAQTKSYAYRYSKIGASPNISAKLAP
jgi:hypothetical protein